MTEAEWMVDPDAERLPRARGDKSPERRIHLFASACCRRVWPLLDDPCSRQAVEAAEHFASGLTRIGDPAQQLYNGDDVRPILHDALLDAGHAELAGHFRAEERHPKGCWLLDLVLGRE
jgi:hypothetical protein